MSISKLDGIGTNRVVNQIKVWNVILPRIHNSHLGILAVSVIIPTRKIAYKIIGIIHDLNIVTIQL